MRRKLGMFPSQFNFTSRVLLKYALHLVLYDNVEGAWEVLASSLNYECHGDLAWFHGNMSFNFLAI